MKEYSRSLISFLLRDGTGKKVEHTTHLLYCHLVLDQEFVMVSEFHPSCYLLLEHLKYSNGHS